MVSTPYDLIADRFGLSRAKLHPKEAEYLALLLESSNQRSSVLDLGCGTGKPIAPGFDIILGEMIDQPTGGRNKGRWATIASRRP